MAHAEYELSLYIIINEMKGVLNSIAGNIICIYGLAHSLSTKVLAWIQNFTISVLINVIMLMFKGTINNF